MGAPFTLKMWPPCDFRSALSPAKSESVYPTRGDTSVEVVLGKTSLTSAVALRYQRTRFAAVRWTGWGFTLYRLSAMTVNAISGRVLIAAYIRLPTIDR